MASINLFKSDMPGCNLNRYFTQTQLDNMSLVEKMIKFNKMKNHFVCQELNIESELPDFMKETLEVCSVKQEDDLNSVKELSEEVKKLLLCSGMPLSYITSLGEAELEGDTQINKLDLPLCKNEDYKKQIWDSMTSIAPIAIKEMEDDYKMRKKALELYRNQKMGIDELRLFFPDSLESLEMAIDNISLKQDNKSRQPRYAFRKVLKKDYCEVESDNESECKSDLLRDTKEDLNNLSQQFKSYAASYNSDSDGSPTRIKWNLPQTFAAKTLPDGLLLRCSNQADAVLGIFAGSEIKKGTIFGPYVGTKVFDEEIVKTSGRVWEVFVNGLLDHFIDGDDSEKSNWMRYVNHADSNSIQNLESFQYRYKIYYRTLMDVPEGTELLVWYSEDYNQDHGDKQTTSKNALKISAAEKSSINKTQKSISKNITCNSSNLFNNATCPRTICNKKSNHSNTERRHKCDVCGTSFNQGYNLKKHMRIHTGEKPYKCDVCGTLFNQNGHLKTHMRTHTSEKPYKCDVCGTSFNQNGNLKTHMRIHTSEKPYKCDVCGTLFSQSCNLNTHMRIHTNEKPYKCDVCGTSFNQNGNLKSHMKVHRNQ